MEASLLLVIFSNSFLIKVVFYVNMVFLTFSELNQCHTISVLLLLDKGEDFVIETTNKKILLLRFDNKCLLDFYIFLDWQIILNPY